MNGNSIIFGSCRFLKCCLKVKLIYKSSVYVTVRGARQDDFRTFCMSEETEKVCQKLEEVINI